jgi:hypothetical protein
MAAVECGNSSTISEDLWKHITIKVLMYFFSLLLGYNYSVCVNALLHGKAVRDPRDPR